MKSDAPQLYGEFTGNVVTPGVPFFGPKSLQEEVMGDVETGFQEALSHTDQSCEGGG